MILSSYEELCWDAEVRRIRARTKVPAGTLWRAGCAICGSRAQVVGHHYSYFAPREVIPLCGSHHQRVHRRLRKRGRDVRAMYFDGRRAGRPAPYEGREWGAVEYAEVHQRRIATCRARFAEKAAR